MTLNWAAARAHCVLNQRHGAQVRPRPCAPMADIDSAATQLADSHETWLVCSALSCPFSVQPRQVAPCQAPLQRKKAHVPDTLPCPASQVARRICTLPAHLKAGSLAVAWGRGRFLYQGDISPQQLSIGVQTQPTYHMTWLVPRLLEP